MNFDIRIAGLIRARLFMPLAAFGLGLPFSAWACRFRPAACVAPAGSLAGFWAGVIFGIQKEQFSTAHVDVDIGTVFSVDFCVLPLRQKIVDVHKGDEMLYFKPLNHGICQNNCGFTHHKDGALNSKGFEILIDGDLDYEHV